MAPPSTGHRPDWGRMRDEQEPQESGPAIAPLSPDVDSMLSHVRHMLVRHGGKLALVCAPFAFTAQALREYLGRAESSPTKLMMQEIADSAASGLIMTSPTGMAPSAANLPNSFQALVQQIPMPQIDPAHALLGLVLVVVMALLWMQAIGTAISWLTPQLTGHKASGKAAALLTLKRLPAMLVMLLFRTLAIMIGITCLVVPGLYLAIRWSVAAPVLLLERAGPLASMSRSGELLKGHFWQVVGMIALYGFCMSIVGTVIEVIANSLDIVGIAISLLWMLISVMLHGTLLVVLWFALSGRQPIYR